jgi:hypothetical protein
MIIQGQVGPLASSASLASGTQPNLRQGNMGDMIVSELHGRYYENTYRRNQFWASNPTGVTTTATTSGTTTAIVGINISNPINSPVNLVLNKVGYAFTVAFAAAADIALGVGYNSGTNVTHTTPLTVRNGYVGIGAAGYGLVDSSVTFPTAPNFIHALGAGLTGAITTTPYIQGYLDLEGSIILPPGAYAGIFTTTAGGASGFFGSFGWEEVPL